MLFTQGHGEARDDAGLDIEQLSSAIEFVRLVDQSVETLIDSFSNHFAPGHQLLTNPISS